MHVELRRRVLEQRDPPGSPFPNRDERLHGVERGIDVVLAGRNQSGVGSQQSHVCSYRSNLSHETDVTGRLMVAEHFAHVRANLELAVYLGAIEANQRRIACKEQRVVSRIAVVPRLEQLIVQISRRGIPLVVCHWARRVERVSRPSSNKDSMRLSGISQISATRAYIPSEMNWFTN